MSKNANHQVAHYLTKREFMATMILQGLLMYPHVRNTGNEDLTVDMAIRYTNELLKRLELEGKKDAEGDL